MTPTEFDKIFNLPFAEASDFFRRKLNIPTQRWDDLWKEEHAKGFMSAGAMKADLLADLHAEVTKAVAGGVTKKEFLARFDEMVAKHGWSYNGGRKWRSNLIYDTNVTTAYQAGRWQQFVDGGAEYLKYVHADGVMHPRPQHVAWNGRVLPIDHPFWKSHYPPNGWRCHCRAVRADRDEATQPPEDFAAVDPKTGAMAGIDKGWDYNVGQAGMKSHAEVLGDKLAKIDADLGAALFAEIKPHARKAVMENYTAWLDSALQGERRKDYALLGSMGKEELIFLKNKGAEPDSSVIVINDRLVDSKKAERHTKAGNALTKEEWRMLPDVVSDPEEILYDTTNSRVLYIYPALADPRKIKIVVETNAYIDKLKRTVNEVTTAFKIDGNALEDRTRYKQIK